MSFVITILDWLTVTLFLALTVVGTMMSIRKKESSGMTKGMFSIQAGGRKRGNEK